LSPAEDLTGWSNCGQARETCHRLGRPKEAREWFDRSSRWMDEKELHNDESKRFRAEAEALLNQE
jgi:hypothetical protein